jgi:hypothetical protein
MNNRELFILPDYNKSKTVEGTTGGTSGKPLRLLIPKNRYIVELNTMNSMWKNVGWKGEIRGVIRNKQLINNQIFICHRSSYQSNKFLITLFILYVCNYLDTRPLMFPLFFLFLKI